MGVTNVVCEGCGEPFDGSITWIATAHTRYPCHNHETCFERTIESHHNIWEKDDDGLSTDESGPREARLRHLHPYLLR